MLRMLRGTPWYIASMSPHDAGTQRSAGSPLPLHVCVSTSARPPAAVRLRHLLMLTPTDPHGIRTLAQPFVTSDQHTSHPHGGRKRFLNLPQPI
jgi:hypothetical protein